MKSKKNHTKWLLSCGMLSTIIYIASDTVCALVYPGYSYTSQAISELSAIGSPTSSLWAYMTLPFNPLIIAFGTGVYLSGKERMLKISGILLSFFGISGYAWLFFPMNMRGNIGSASDTGHLVLSAITVILLTLILAFGSGADGKKFRTYSFFTILLMLFFGSLVGMMVSSVAAQEPTPWMGLYERIGVFSPMIWMSVFAIILLRKDKAALK